MSSGSETQFTNSPIHEFTNSVDDDRLMQAGLLGIASSDPRIAGAFAAILIAASLLAGYLPARRAAAIDPISALRME